MKGTHLLAALRSRLAAASIALAAFPVFLIAALPSAGASFPERTPRHILQPSRVIFSPTGAARLPAQTPAGRAFNPSPNATFSTDLFLLGSTEVEIDQRSRTLRIFLDEVFNASEVSSSTTTYLEVWATPALAYFGEGIPAGSKLLATFDFPILLPRERFLDSSTAWIPFAAPPDETWNVLLVLTEDFGGGQQYQDTDYRNNGWRVFGSSALMTSYGVSASVTFRNPYDAQARTGTAYPTFLNDEFTFFDFGSPKNPEIFVKVLAGNSPDYIQLFVGGTTDFEYTVTFQGCGQHLTFTKKPFVTDGYANGKAIPKSACPK